MEKKKGNYGNFPVELSLEAMRKEHELKEQMRSTQNQGFSHGNFQTFGHNNNNFQSEQGFQGRQSFQSGQGFQSSFQSGQGFQSSSQSGQGFQGTFTNAPSNPSLNQQNSSSFSFFPTEESYGKMIFQQADQDKDGRIGNADALFFRKSQLPDNILGMIWASFKKPFLTQMDFYLALRMIYLAQCRDRNFNNLSYVTQLKQWKEPNFIGISPSSQSQNLSSNDRNQNTTNSLTSNTVLTGSINNIALSTTSTGGLNTITSTGGLNTITSTGGLNTTISTGGLNTTSSGVFKPSYESFSAPFDTKQNQPELNLSTWSNQPNTTTSTGGLNTTTSTGGLNTITSTGGLNTTSSGVFKPSYESFSAPFDTKQNQPELNLSTWSNQPNTTISTGGLNTTISTGGLNTITSTGGLNTTTSGVFKPSYESFSAPSDTKQNQSKTVTSTGELSDQKTSIEKNNETSQIPHQQSKFQLNPMPSVENLQPKNQEIKWELTNDQKKHYLATFNKTVGNEKSVNGQVGRELFLKSQLPQQILGQIWQLADFDKDGKLILEEFFVAMHLIFHKKNGGQLPKSIPPFVFQMYSQYQSNDQNNNLNITINTNDLNNTNTNNLINTNTPNISTPTSEDKKAVDLSLYILPLNRVSAEKTLKSSGDEVMLLRESSRIGRVALSAYSPEKNEFQHYLIKANQKGWKFQDDKTYYNSLNDLMHDHRIRNFQWIDHEKYDNLKKEKIIGETEPIFGIIKDDKSGGFQLVAVDSKRAKLPNETKNPNIKIFSKKSLEVTSKSKYEETATIFKKTEFAWNFKTKANNIGFSVVFNGKEVVPYQLYDSHLKTIQGVYLATDFGTYKFIWDNTFSWFTAKNLTFEINGIESDEKEEEEFCPSCMKKFTITELIQHAPECHLARLPTRSKEKSKTMITSSVDRKPETKAKTKTISFSKSIDEKKSSNIEPISLESKKYSPTFAAFNNAKFGEFTQGENFGNFESNSKRFGNLIVDSFGDFGNSKSFQTSQGNSGTFEGETSKGFGDFDNSKSLEEFNSPKAFEEITKDPLSETSKGNSSAFEGETSKGFEATEETISLESFRFTPNFDFENTKEQNETGNEHTRPDIDQGLVGKLIQQERLQEAKACENELKIQKEIKDLEKCLNSPDTNSKDKLEMKYRIVGLQLQIQSSETISKWISPPSSPILSLSKMIEELKIQNQLDFLEESKFSHDSLVNLSFQNIDLGIEYYNTALKLYKSKKVFQNKQEQKRQDSVFKPSIQISSQTVKNWQSALDRCQQELESGEYFIKILFEKCSNEDQLSLVKKSPKFTQFLLGLKIIISVSLYLTKSTEHFSDFLNLAPSAMSIIFSVERISKSIQVIKEILLKYNLWKEPVLSEIQWTNENYCFLCHLPVSLIDENIIASKTGISHKCCNVFFAHFMKKIEN